MCHDPGNLQRLSSKTDVHLLSGDQLKRPRVRLLNLGFTTVLVAVTYVIWVGSQRMVGVSFSTGFAFYPDLTGTAVVTMVLAMLLATGRLVIAVRGK